MKQTELGIEEIKKQIVGRQYFTPRDVPFDITAQGEMFEMEEGENDLIGNPVTSKLARQFLAINNIDEKEICFNVHSAFKRGINIAMARKNIKQLTGCRITGRRTLNKVKCGKWQEYVYENIKIEDEKAVTKVERYSSVMGRLESEIADIIRTEYKTGVTENDVGAIMTKVLKEADEYKKTDANAVLNAIIKAIKKSQEK